MAVVVVVLPLLLDVVEVVRALVCELFRLVAAHLHCRKVMLGMKCRKCIEGDWGPSTDTKSLASTGKQAV